MDRMRPIPLRTGDAGEMYTEMACQTLGDLHPTRAIRAIHQAYLQLNALSNNVDCEHYDNDPAIKALYDCLKEAGHIGFLD